MEILIAKKFKIIKKISEGAFGQIYHAININSGQELAVKLEKVDAKFPQVIQEAKILNELLNNCAVTDKGIPSLYWSGVQGDYNVMVMDLLGSNLQQLLNKNGGTFTIKTTLMVFLQMVKRIQYVHNKQYLHRDIKPQNFILGRDDKKQKLYIIDFGLSKKYIKNNMHIPYIQGRSMSGTVRYASINTHLGIQPTRRDDLQSLIFLVYYFLYGKLPWQGIEAPTTAQKYNKILALKIENKPQKFFGNLPDAIKYNLIEIFKHIRNLKYDQKPNYQFIKIKIHDCFVEMKIEHDYNYDWTVNAQKQYLSKKSPSLIKQKSHSRKISLHGSGVSQNKNQKLESEQKMEKIESKNKQKQKQLLQVLGKLKGVKIQSK